MNYKNKCNTASACNKMENKNASTYASKTTKLA